MIGECDEQRLVVAELEGLANDRVAPAITVVDDLSEFGTRGHAAVGRVIGLGEPPEQVLDSVRRVEQAVEEPFFERLELVEHHRLALAPDDLALVEIGLLGDPLVVQSGMVFDHAGRVIKTDALGELAGVFGWIADREEGRVGVEVDRRGIQGELGLAA